MKIERSELLRYLGYKGQRIDGKIEENISAAISLCKSKITPRHAIRKYALEREPLALKGTDVILKGKDISAHLADCSEVYLMGATVGFEIEKTVSRLMKENPLLGVMVDSASICAIESYCDDLCEELQAENEKLLTWRFSCGYGDFPLSQQADFVRLLELPKKIGVFMNEQSFMLSPQKSVTAIIGIKDNSEVKSNACKAKCLNCGNANCTYRK